jgi:endonuclease/exonuclease/phosphatase (EEP) superfamily protein YafD
MLLATVYPLSAVEPSLLVVNSHIINFVSFEKYKAHLNQVFQTLEHHAGPILLAGDFNTWNGKRLKYFSDRARAFALEEVPMKRQPKLSHLLQHLDHIYCRGLEVVDAKVHTDIHTSDHYPISLSLRSSNPTAMK